MNESVSWPQALDAINNLELSMTWTTLGRELRALDAMNNFAWKTPSCELMSLDAMKNLGLYDISRSRSLAQGLKCYEQLWVVVDMNNSE